MPTPSSIGNYLYQELFTTHKSSYTTILEKSIQSLTDAVLGFIISLSIGTAIGIIFAKLKLIRFSFSPILFAVQLLPIPAFAPVIASIFGYGYSTKIIIIVLFTIFPVIIAIQDSVNSIPKNYERLFRSYNVSWFEKLRSLIFPSIIPSVLHLMTILFTAAFVASIIAELPLTISSGIGKDIYNSFNNQYIPRVWSSIVVISILSLIVFMSFNFLDKYINQRYKYGHYPK